MKYVAIVTTTDTDERMNIDAIDARQAHDVAAKAYPTAETVRVYPATDTDAGIVRGAIMVIRRTAVNGVLRTGGTPTQAKLERETAALNARVRGVDDAARLFSMLPNYSHDMQDMLSDAMTALTCTVGATLEEKYAAAYREVNKAIHEQAAASEYEISTEFLLDGNGDLVSLNAAIAAIIHGTDKWTPTDGGTMDAETAARLGAALSAALRTVNPTQRKIAEYLARGYSQRRIATETRRDVRTVSRNIAILREKVGAYLDITEFAPLIRAALVSAAAKKATASQKGGKKDAEYYREYRARKAAERAAKTK